MKSTVIFALTAVLSGMSLSAQVFAEKGTIPIFTQMESKSSWKSQDDACTYGIQRAKSFAKRECRRAHGGEPGSSEDNCQDFRQMKSGNWKATGNVILNCKLDD
ncbi:hypothetical protein [Amphritea sp.]|uniref:hypothetical protein n=1 Tax=Amphritea sp. TaxID=1872502 RepID=UPI0025BD3F4A|nr:hypothetical protein [Amphritea sp.]